MRTLKMVQMHLQNRNRSHRCRKETYMVTKETGEREEINREVEVDAYVHYHMDS